MTTKLGLCTMYPAPGILECIGKNWDWIWIDGQHGAFADYNAMVQMVRACNFIDREAYVRVPGTDGGWVGMALDAGADAVIVPQVDSVEHAVNAVVAAKFPPLGNRSFGGRRVIDLAGRVYYQDANRRSKLICQIESPEALENVKAIASVTGVDGLFLGPDDLMLRLGHDLTKPLDREVLLDAVKKVAEACSTYEKECICVATTTETMITYQKLGATHLVGGSDVGFLTSGSKNAVDAARKCLSDGKSGFESAVPNFDSRRGVY